MRQHVIIYYIHVRQKKLHILPNDIQARAYASTALLTTLGLLQIANPGVLEVVCRTLLEKGVSLLALQEVTDPSVLEKVSRMCQIIEIIAKR